MGKPDTYQALNRLFAIVYRSLPMYLAYACPWTHQGDEKAMATLRHITEDYRQLCDRIAAYILKIGPLETGEYPIDFLDTHDLSLDYLIGKLVVCQKMDIAAIERCVTELQGDRPAAALGEEALGAARGHLESLEELAGQLAKNAQ